MQETRCTLWKEDRRWILVLKYILLWLFNINSNKRKWAILLSKFPELDLWRVPHPYVHQHHPPLSLIYQVILYLPQRVLLYLLESSHLPWNGGPSNTFRQAGSKWNINKHTDDADWSSRTYEDSSRSIPDCCLRQSHSTSMPFHKTPGHNWKDSVPRNLNNLLLLDCAFNHSTWVFKLLHSILWGRSCRLFVTWEGYCCSSIDNSER